jgi:hypothetical protein
MKQHGLMLRSQAFTIVDGGFLQNIMSFIGTAGDPDWPSPWESGGGNYFALVPMHYRVEVRASPSYIEDLCVIPFSPTDNEATDVNGACLEVIAHTAGMPNGNNTLVLSFSTLAKCFAIYASSGMVNPTALTMINPAATNGFVDLWLVYSSPGG